MGLGPGGQPINANRLNSGGGMGSMGPGGQSAVTWVGAGAGGSTRFACVHGEAPFAMFIVDCH